MLHKTRGIVFKTTDYSDTSVVVQVFTEKFGLQSYLINGVKRPKAKIRLNSLQPLYLLDMVVYHKISGNIQRVSELRHQPIFQQIPYDIAKSSIILFLNEVIYKSLRLHDADEVLFEFLFHAIEILDSLEEGIANFHLYFLLRFTRFLGFYPDMNSANLPYFDLREGVFKSHQPPHSFILEPELSQIWKNLLNSNFDQLASLQISSTDRRLILQKIMDFYASHIEGFGNVKALGVLEDVMS